MSKFHFSSPKNNEFEFDEIVPTSNVLKPLVICSQSLKTGNWIHLITGIGEDNIKIAEKSSASALVRSHITFAHTVVEKNDAKLCDLSFLSSRRKWWAKSEKFPIARIRGAKLTF